MNQGQGFDSIILDETGVSPTNSYRRYSIIKKKSAINGFTYLVNSFDEYYSYII